MTGQVKEEVLTRFGELGIRVSNGEVRFQPDLLRAREFIAEPRTFCFLDIDGNWQDVDVPANALAFTWCQVAVIYQLDDRAEPAVAVVHDDGSTQAIDGLALPAAESAALFQRSGRVRQLTVTIRSADLFTE